MPRGAGRDLTKDLTKGEVFCRSSETQAVERWEMEYSSRGAAVQRREDVEELVGPGEARTLFCFYCILRPAAMDDTEAAQLLMRAMEIETPRTGEEGSAATPPRRGSEDTEPLLLCR